MRKKIFFPLAVFVLIFLLHAGYSIWEASKISRQWVQVDNASLLLLYLKQQNFFLSFSYALAGAFTVYALLKFLKNRRGGVAGVVGGITITGILYAGGCFLLGCCGSPMFAVYMGLFGSSFLGVAKPITAAITAISVIIGYFWIEKKSKVCCMGDEKC